MLSCFLCQKEHDFSENLLSHLREFHKLIDTSNCMCNICFINVPFKSYGQHMCLYMRSNRNKEGSKGYLDPGHIPFESEPAYISHDTHLSNLLQIITENDEILTECVLKLCKECNIHFEHLQDIKKHHLKILFPRTELGSFIKFEKLLLKWQMNSTAVVGIEQSPSIVAVQSLPPTNFMGNVEHSLSDPKGFETFKIHIYESTEDSQDVHNSINNTDQEPKKKRPKTSAERVRSFRERQKLKNQLNSNQKDTPVQPSKPKTSTERVRYYREKQKAQKQSNPIRLIRATPGSLSDTTFYDAISLAEAMKTRNKGTSDEDDLVQNEPLDNTDELTNNLEPVQNSKRKTSTERVRIYRERQKAKNQQSNRIRLIRGAPGSLNAATCYDEENQHNDEISFVDEDDLVKNEPLDELTNDIPAPPFSQIHENVIKSEESIED